MTASKRVLLSLGIIGILNQQVDPYASSVLRRFGRCGLGSPTFELFALSNPQQQIKIDMVARLLELEMVDSDEDDDGCDGEVQQHYYYPQTAERTDDDAKRRTARTAGTTASLSSSSEEESDDAGMPPSVSYTDLFLHNPQFDWFLLSYIVTNLGEYVVHCLLAEEGLFLILVGGDLTFSSFVPSIFLHHTHAHTTPHTNQTTTTHHGHQMVHVRGEYVVTTLP
jgi:hypothetical protein